MREEIGINIKGVELKSFHGDVSNSDLRLEDESGNFICICGNNDWGKIALKILKPYKREADRIIKQVEDMVKTGFRPEVILLGKTEKTVMDVVSGTGRCDNILNIPIATSEKNSELRFIGAAQDLYLPFE